MKLQRNPTTVLATTVSAFCALVVAGFQVASNLNSDKAESSRVKALQTVTQHIMSDSCLEVGGRSLFTIGQEIVIDTETGKSPTSCFTNKTQYAYAGYLGGKLRVIYTFSRKEVESKSSILRNPKK